MKVFIFVLFFCYSSLLVCQITEGIDFTKYPAKQIALNKKAAIQWVSNPYKNRVKEIKDGYQKGTISFGGSYITVLWLCGNDCAQGVLIDSRTGRIYKMPINSTNTSNQCQDREDIFDRYLFFPYSKLVATSTCKTQKEALGVKVHQDFFFYLWNEPRKTFSLLKKVKKERSDK